MRQIIPKRTILSSVFFILFIFRESLFLLTYLLFLINTVVGLVVAIWRMVITALYNILHLGRIDISLLHRTAESFDPGKKYFNFRATMESYNTNTILYHICD